MSTSTNNFEFIFHQHSGNRVMAIEALAATHGIDGENIPDLGYVEATGEIVILLREAGEPVDVLYVDLESGDHRLANDDDDTETASTPWAGKDNMCAPVVRLHANLSEWLAAGCTGVCNLARTSRRHMRDLSQADSIVCNCVYTALQAHDWGKVELNRFTVDGPTDWYFEDSARYEAVSTVEAERRT
jgi:hypothetical protein